MTAIPLKSVILVILENCSLDISISGKYGIAVSTHCHVGIYLIHPLSTQ